MYDSWIGSLVGAAILVVFLYGPGILALWRTRIPRVLSVACAPLVCVAPYALLPVLYSVFGIACSWAAIVVPVAIVALAIFVVLGHGKSTQQRDGVFLEGSRSNWATLFLYCAVGIVATMYIFVANLDGPSAYVQEYDNVAHLAYLRSFLETGTWSTLSVSAYAAPGSINPYEGGAGFYPAAWHVLAVTIADCVGLSIPQAMNVVNGVFVALVFPSGMFVFLSAVFPENKNAVRFGALVTMSVVAFPWDFLIIWGPLFPNLIAYCLLPALMTSFMSLFCRGGGKPFCLTVLAVFILGCVSAALCQPNAIFAAAVVLSPFVVGRSYSIAKEKKGASVFPVAVASGVAGAIVAIWCVCFVLPPMQGVVWHNWDPFYSKTQALANILFLSLTGTNAQLFLAVVTLAGAWLILLHRRARWIVVAYGLAAVVYFACGSLEGWWQHFLAGFWYSDCHRTAATLVFCIVPLASVCLAGAYDALKRLAGRYRPNGHGGLLAATVLALVFATAVFFPSFELRGFGDVGTAFTQVRDKARMAYTSQKNVFDNEEYEFVQEVLQVVGDEDVVANEPNDGSAFSYGTLGLNVLYRNTRGYGEEENGGRDIAASEVIRLKLDELANNEEVQRAVDELGVRYVLTLDRNADPKKSRFLFTYRPELFPGITSIDESTPGFELVLSRDDMRLYKIEETS